MVSALWKACAEGNLERVSAILTEESVDIEIKDHTGVTPLICAVQSGHLEIVRLLLDKGADPANVSSQGPPESYTTDQGILDLLFAAKNKMASNGQAFEPGYSHDTPVDPAKFYPPPPPGAYYYPGMPAPPILPEGAVPYYPPPPADPNANGVSNLPPPDIARLIPCRYYPACRYGSSCMFAHPQGPYLQGPLPPPAQYPVPYDPMAAPYPTYYPVPPPSFPPPNGNAMNPTSPTMAHNPPPISHNRSGSEVVSPIQAPFNPNHMPPPVPYGVSPVSPTYSQPGPIPVPVPMPPPHFGGPQSPQQATYPPTSPTVSGAMPAPYGVQRNPMAPPYPSHPYGPAHGEGIPPPKVPLPQQADGSFAHGPVHRDGFNHHRRGGNRKASFGSRSLKPPCMFFPSGRCRNGDDCRFPHVLPDGPASHFAGRGGHRPRPSTYVNGYTGIEDKLATMTVNEQQQAGVNGNVTDGSSRSQSTEPGQKGRGFHGPKTGQFPNGGRYDKRPFAPKPQRVPSADEFPVLGGSSTPPLRTPTINGHSGPTAAQVLQAPPPRKEKDSQPSTRGASPTGERSEQASATDKKPEVNGTTNGNSSISPPQTTTKLPVSFAAVATAAATPAAPAPDASKEVSVSA
ncbi:hypothetical protein K474DRAFT_1704890 [Panus rudis PR-1116 ss-1]|nr:hypothetical protein K474DRAFT_1704890 [Panus rudis PR-1116 ss-1]